MDKFSQVQLAKYCQLVKTWEGCMCYFEDE